LLGLVERRHCKVLGRTVYRPKSYLLRGIVILKNTRGMLRPLATCAFVLAVALTSSLVAPSVASAQAVVYRVNGGGAAITGTPQWDADTKANPSPFVNAAQTGNQTSSTSNAIDLTNPSVPAGTPQALFQTERWDPPTTPEMQWDFPVTPGTYQVRLYFAEIYSGAQSVGARVFDVSIEGNVVLNDYDIFADVGGFKGVVKTFTVTADSNLDIDFGHVTENPKVNAIEILAGAQPNQLGATPSSLSFGQVVVGQTNTLAVQLTNLGQSGDPGIVVDATTLTGTDPGQFSDNFNDANDVTLAPGQSTTINVTFGPTNTGAKSATLSVAHSGSNSPLAVSLTGNGMNIVPVGFGKSSLQGETSSAPTSLQFGPDGRLYVGQFDGSIKVYTISRNAANNYSVTATETITAIQSVPNHDDNGAPNPSIATRLLTGILVTGTASNPVIYVAHSDPRIGGGSSGADLNLDTNSSMISRLTWTGSTWQKLDLVRGLPRSEENHAANGMQLDASTNTLYVAMGGNTNKGAPSNNFAFLPEYALSAGILSVDLDAIGNTTYDIPTLNDEDRPGNPDANDPFGGNDGKNQAKLVPGGPVQVYAPGFRNPYDLVITKSGKMYTIDNGANAGWGNFPVNEGPAGNCTNDPNEPGTTDQDALHLVVAAGYYGGHPNPTRANTANTFNPSNPQSPVSSGNAIECDYRKVGTTESTALTAFASSTNGIDEYTASNFGGQLSGNLLAAGYVNNEIYRIVLSPSGAAVTSNSVLFSTVGSGPLDIVAQGDQEPFPGSIWVADQKNGNIYVFEPNDFGGGGSTCSGADDPNLDEDSDGFSNADEIDNGTDPCSAADIPPDWDGDHVSNLNDPDDDNDGTPDTSDPFAIDPDNGSSTSLPVQYTWENDAPNPGGLLNLGFTGLMTNGTADYESLYDADKMTAGGAAGVLTVDEVSEGDALGTLNSQQYGFQFGLKAPPSTTNAFTVHTRILGPFNGLTPQDNESMGLFVGTGDQDNYVKIVTDANGGSGGIQFTKEVGGTVTVRPGANVTLPGPDYVDLYLMIDPDAATVQPRYSVTTGGVTGPLTDLGGSEPVPSGWFTGSTGLAIGIISTSSGPGVPFPATWDFIEAVPETVTDPSAIAQDTFTRTVTDSWGTADIGGPWTVVAGTAANFDVNGGSGTVATPGGTKQQAAHLGQVSVRDVDAKVAMTFPDAPIGSGNTTGFLLLRRQTGGAYYRVGLYVTSAGKVFIRGQTSAGATLFPDVNTGLSFTAGDTFLLRVQAEGGGPTTIRARAWEQGTAEPTSWKATATDATAGLQQAGSVGIRTVNTTSTATTLRFDDLAATPI
jgi:large repetitive protein